MVLDNQGLLKKELSKMIASGLTDKHPLYTFLIDNDEMQIKYRFAFAISTQNSDYILHK